MSISGWFESEYGAEIVDISEARDASDLAQALYLKYGEGINGVDMELDGEYADGSDVNDTFDELLDEIAFLCERAFLSAEAMMDNISSSLA